MIDSAATRALGLHRQSGNRKFSAAKVNCRTDGQFDRKLTALKLNTRDGGGRRRGISNRHLILVPDSVRGKHGDDMPTTCVRGFARHAREGRAFVRGAERSRERVCAVAHSSTGALPRSSSGGQCVAFVSTLAVCLCGTSSNNSRLAFFFPWRVRKPQRQQLYRFPFPNYSCCSCSSSSISNPVPLERSRMS